TAKWYLLYSPRFWAVQTLQKVMTMGWAYSSNMKMMLAGLPKASVEKAFFQDFFSTSRGTKLSTGENLKEYIEREGHATPYYVESIDPTTRFNDPVAKAIERYTRQGGARLAYNLFRQNMPE